MSPEKTAKAKIEWGPVMVAGVGAVVLFFGAWGYYLRGHFGWSDVLACGLALLPAGLFLLVSSYVFQHAPLVIPLPILLAVVLVRGYPGFGVAMGLVLVGIAGNSLLDDWKNRKHSKLPAPENKEQT